MRVHFEDWTPLFEEPCENENGRVEVDDSAVALYWQAKLNLLDAHEAMMATRKIL